MLTSLATSASGLRHAEARQRAAAHDTANLTTPETVVLRATGHEVGDARGVRSQISGQVERRPSTAPAPVRQDAVALQVEALAATRSSGANAAALRTADAMLGTLLDAIG